MTTVVALKEDSETCIETCIETAQQALRRLLKLPAEMETMTGTELRTWIETLQEPFRSLQETLRRHLESLAALDDVMTRDRPFGD